MLKFFKENKKIFIILFILLLFISCFRVLAIYFIQKILEIRILLKMNIEKF